MKKFIAVLFLILFQFISAQEIITKDLGDFNSLRVFDGITVELIPSNTNKIEITGERSQEVDLVNKRGELKIRMPLKKFLKGEKINTKLYFKFIDNIEASEGSYIYLDQISKGISFALSAKEGAEINIKLEAEKVNVKSNSGATITLSGKAKIQDIVVTSGAVVNAKDLETSQTTVSINAGGNVEIKAEDLVDAKTRAGGKIIIYGNPKKIEEKTIFGGTIKRFEQ